jgi:quinol monooxygenase YgiN
MKSPWKSLAPLEHGHEYLVLASSIPPKSRLSTWRLFLGSRQVTARLRDTPGVVGFALLARPLRKQYATLSVWADEQALQAFANAEPHRRLMQALAPDMGPTRFVRWAVNGSDGRPSWREGLDRLAESR